jgi:hypothetical protein
LLPGGQPLLCGRLDLAEHLADRAEFRLDVARVKQRFEVGDTIPWPVGPFDVVDELKRLAGQVRKGLADGVAPQKLPAAVGVR